MSTLKNMTISTKNNKITLRELENFTGKMFFTSDTHFGSQRTLELSKRPFTSVEEMDEEMVKRWNSVVGPDDVVVHLGDFGKFDIRKRLNGKLILIQGNYEEEMKNEAVLEALNPTDAYIVGDGDQHAFIDFNHAGCVYNLTHRPVDCYMSDLLSHDYSKYFSLFGHIHGRQFIKKFGIDVGVDCNHFYPIDWERVEFFQNAIVKGYYDENVFC